MHIQSHAIIAAALFGRRLPRNAIAAVAGGLLPDLPSIVIALALKFFGVPAIVVLGLLRWMDWWQIVDAVAHNFWIWGGVLLLAIALRERRSLGATAIDRWSLAVVFASSGFLHCIIDFLVQREDGHMQFWPVSRWKFLSPISYWNPQYYGTWFTVFETLLGLGLALWLLSCCRSWVARIALVLAMFLYISSSSQIIFS